MKQLKKMSPVWNYFSVTENNVKNAFCKHRSATIPWGENIKTQQIWLLTLKQHSKEYEEFPKAFE